MNATAQCILYGTGVYYLVLWYRVILLGTVLCGMPLTYFAWHRNMLDNTVMFGITHNAQYFSARPITMSQYSYIAQDYLSMVHDYATLHSAMNHGT